MLVATPGIVLHTTPYGDSSVVVRVFTRLLGVRSYIIKGVRGPRGRIKQNLLQPMTSLDMVVYDNPRNDLNHVKELAPRHPGAAFGQVGNAMCFFMTEVLYKALREAEPMPDLFDYAEQAPFSILFSTAMFPTMFLLTVAHHLGIEPLDNFSTREPLFDLQEGRFVSAASETTLSSGLSDMLHQYLSPSAHWEEEDSAGQGSVPPPPYSDRRSLLDALLAYYQLHLSGFHNFHSHEILHTVLR